MDQHGLRRAGSSRGLLDCARDEVHVEGVPPTGFNVEPGAVIARVASWDAMIELGGRDLTSHGHEVVALVRASLGLPPTGQPGGLAHSSGLSNSVSGKPLGRSIPE